LRLLTKASPLNALFGVPLFNLWYEAPLCCNSLDKKIFCSIFVPTG
jgi:hypothetical protein